MPELPRDLSSQVRMRPPSRLRRLRRKRSAATGEKAVLAGVPEEDREFVTGVWPPEFERILNGESASMLAQDARLGKL